MSCLCAVFKMEGEGGVLGVWDCMGEKCIEVLSIDLM